MVRVEIIAPKPLGRGSVDRSRVFHASYTGGLRIRPTLFKVSSRETIKRVTLTLNEEPVI